MFKLVGLQNTSITHNYIYMDIDSKTSVQIDSMMIFCIGYFSTQHNLAYKDASVY
jgi:hypothetical protein